MVVAGIIVHFKPERYVKFFIYPFGQFCYLFKHLYRAAFSNRKEYQEYFLGVKVAGE